jgi:hypothetical protein
LTETQPLKAKAANRKLIRMKNLWCWSIWIPTTFLRQIDKISVFGLRDGLDLCLCQALVRPDGSLEEKFASDLRNFLPSLKRSGKILASYLLMTCYDEMDFNFTNHCRA